MRVLFLVCGLSVLLGLPWPAQAQWKWKDARGQTHVSDIPPPREIEDKDILQRPAPPKRSGPAGRAVAATPAAAGAAAAAAASAAAASAVASRPGVDPELEARKARAEAEQRAKAKAEEDKLAAQRAENCQRARQHMTALQSGQRMARTNSKGEREVLDDNARADEMVQARRVIDSDCR